MNLHALTVIDALAGLKSKKFTSVELTQACLDRIKELNPKLNVYVTLNPHALDEAKRADQVIAKDESKPLTGIPIAIKDNFLTLGLRTTASSKVLDNYIPQYDATVVQKLKAAGTIILGKTNMDAWAHGSSTETSDYGPTLNPWNTGHLPGGSSGGSAAAVAGDMCIAAIGSETAGSIRQPAAWCGVTGFKPTYGRVSRYGVIAMASSTDSPGPITKTVADSAFIGSVLAGPDRNDATTSHQDAGDWLSDINNLKSEIRNLKVGLAIDYLLPEMRNEVKKLIQDAARKFEELGAKVSEISLLDPKYSIGVYTIVQRSEVSSNLARYDGIRYGFPRDHFGEEAKRRIMLGTYTLSAGYIDQFYAKAQKVRTLVIRDFAKAFSRVDLIIGPTSPGPALKLGASKDQPMFGEMEDVLVEPSSIAGLTGISVPCGFVDGLPIGLDIIGPQFSEYKVLSAAHVFEQSTPWHLSKPDLKF